MIFFLVMLELATIFVAAYYYEQYLKILAALKPLGTIEKQKLGHKCIVKLDKIIAVIDDKVQASETKLRWMVRVESGIHKGSFGKVVVIMEDKSIFIEDLSFTKLYKINAEDYVKRLHLRY